jgi:glyoxylase-like metal-dependent hydrolase (beta-lactamase superfamily II)
MLVVRSAVVGPFAMNAWLAACSETGEAVLVDPGAELPRLLALREPGGWRINRLFLTHGHIDHVGAAAEAREATGAPLTLHADDVPWLARLPQSAELFGLGEVRIPTLDGPHADGEVVRVGRLEARVLHTPGHSAGSTCLWFPTERVVFTGDTLFAGSVGRTDLPGGDFEALERSIKEQLLTLGDDVKFLPGHGPGGTIGEERRSNPFVGDAPRRGRFL